MNRFGMMIDTTKLYIWILDLNLDSRSQECKKAKPSAAIISESFQSLLVSLGILLTSAIAMNLILILSHPFNVQGREPCLCDFVLKK